MARGGLVIALAIEAGVTLLQFATLIYTIAAYDLLATAILVARALVAMSLATAAWLLTNNAPPARTIARAALLASAVLYVFDAGLALAPSIAPPFFRWQFVGAYWVYAGLAVWALSRRAP